ncbi:MAG: glycoside hydrolase family 78 protein [Rikenellaceae bacterium]|nr:glycoside hydrolase family 78 protein [Rikenellaceae bacterium]
MKRPVPFYAILPGVVLCIALSGCSRPAPRVSAMRCEYMVEPIGVDGTPLRFTWNLSAPDGIRPTGYILEVSPAEDFQAEVTRFLTEDSYVLPAVLDIEIEPFTKYYWRVAVKFNNGSTYLSPASRFESGMVSQESWQGKWISDGGSVDVRPAPYFRKEFQVKGEIRSARAYITSAGYNELSLNGEKVGDRFLDPGYTKFDKRTLYSTYDITDRIKKGDNAVGVVLGNGWYNHQSTAVWDYETAYWRARPLFLLNIRIEYADGSVETISTDGSWRTTDQGPIVFNSIYTAEHYDARRQMPGWNRAGYDDSQWATAIVMSSPTEKIVSQQMEPVRVTDELRPVGIDIKSDTCCIYDFGRNIAGSVKLRVEGREGVELRLIHAERLGDDGHVDMSNIDCHYRPTDDTDPFQTDIVILKDGITEFMPKFNYKGFQYVEVHCSEPLKLDKDNLTAFELHSDVKPVGKIGCSNKTVEKLWAASNSSYLANLFGYPTDCPQREKNGWTGDAQLNIETALYNFDAITVYEKWLEDHIDEQRPDGVLPSIIPTAGWGYDWGNGPDWTSTITVIPWQIYMFYGDATLLKKVYPYAKKYVDYIHSSRSEGYLTDWGLGDWIPVETRSNQKLTSSVFYYRNALILSKAAALFGYEEDAGKYKELAENIRSAINREFLDFSTGIYCEGSQTELSLPLYFGVPPLELRSKVAGNLYRRVAENDFKLDVGLLGSKSLLNALSENGYADAAYKVASAEEFPSWGWWIVNGATTFYENWNIDSEHDISLNHIMYGEVNAWLYKGLGGIFPDEKNPGFRNVILRPNFVDGLESFTAKHNSVYGEIVSSWEKSGSKINYTVRIPAGCRATFYPPENVEGEYTAPQGETSLVFLDAGEHKFSFTIK